MKTLLDYAKITIGYDYNVSGDNENRLIVTVAAGDEVHGEWPEADKSLKDIRELVGPAFDVEFTGNGNTDRDGESTFDVAVSLIDGYWLANIHEAGNGFPEKGAFLLASDGETYRLVRYIGRTQTKQWAANWRMAIVEASSCEEEQEFPAKLELFQEAG